MNYIKDYDKFIINEEIGWADVKSFARSNKFGLGFLGASLIFNIMMKTGVGERVARMHINYSLRSEPSLNKDKVFNQAMATVKAKVNADTSLKNKEEILRRLDKVIYIETDYRETAVAFYYHNQQDDIDYIALTKGVLQDTEYRTNTHVRDVIQHELYHLVDTYNDDTINWDEIITAPGEEEYSRYYLEIMGYYELELSDKLAADFKGISEKAADDYIDKMEYFISASELYARVNNLKMLLYNEQYLKSPQEEISRKLWLDIFSGEFAIQLMEKDKDKYLDFIKSDVIQILPILKNSKLKDINKIAQLDTTQNQNIA